jgi:hypothetical protein
MWENHDNQTCPGNGTRANTNGAVVSIGVVARRDLPKAAEPSAHLVSRPGAVETVSHPRHP